MTSQESSSNSGIQATTVELGQDSQLPVEKLEKYLHQTLNLHQQGPPVIRKFGYGVSNLTYYIEYGGMQMVLRMEPPPKSQIIPFGHGMKHEFSIIKALAPAGIPVPEALALCEDRSVLGAPFYIMKFIKGRVLEDPKLSGMAPQERKEIYDEVVRVLVKLHNVDLESTGIVDLDEKGNFFRRHIERYAKLYEENKTDDIPEMDKVVTWLRDNIPAEESTVLVHGDYRIGNMIFHDSKPEVLAIIDWERWSIADRTEDLTYTGIVMQMTGGAEGIPTVPELKAAYFKEAGIPPISDWRFYDASTYFRLSAAFQYTKNKKIEENLPDDHPGMFMVNLVEPVAKTAWATASGDSPEPR